VPTSLRGCRRFGWQAAEAVHQSGERSERNAKVDGLLNTPVSNVTVTLPDGSQRSAPRGTTVRDFAASALPASVVKKALAASVDGRLVDLSFPLEQDAALKLMLPDGADALALYRHSTAHLLAAAVTQLFPGAQCGIGPATDDGFFYDFVVSRPFVPEDLEKIEKRMRELAGQDLPYERQIWPRQEAIDFFAKRGEPLKVQLIEEKTAGQSHVSCYTIKDRDTFVDFCVGPHVPSTGRLKAFKVLSASNAYWKGDQRNQPMQRIYGTAFFKDDELKQHLHRIEESKKRDHRRLGKDLELFTVNEAVGAGLPLWLPKGATVRRLLEDYIVGREREAGYEHVYTPHLAKVDLYVRSGHWQHYHDSMFPTMDLDPEQMVLRPMNCPHHILIYESKTRSYRDLPVKLAELGTMYRYERSGVLSGLSRVRAMTLNDAHIFCTPEQIKEEFSKVMQLVELAYRDLGITDYSYRLSLRDPANREKYVDNDAMWELGERVLREAMDSLGLPYQESVGDAAFYGPKVDIQLADVMGHEETYSTIQVDFHLPNQFGLEYVGADGQRHRPVIIHRGVISTMERMMSYLIELYGGAFPLWLAPVQAVVLPITERQLDYAAAVESTLAAAGLRVELDRRQEKIGFKIREAQLQKVPYMLVIGDREAAEGTVAVRTRAGGDQGAMTLDAFVSAALDEVRQKRA
jgi:threonyl-tRNA synthetase